MVTRVPIRPALSILLALMALMALDVLAASAVPPDAATPEEAAAPPASQPAVPQPTATPQTSPPADETPPRRVIVRVSRFREVAGWIELDEDDVMVVRKADGELESFATGRLLQIVRLVDPEPGQQGRVILRNGQSRAGTVIEDGFERVVLEIEGIRTTFKRESVDHVALTPSFDALYANFKANLRPEMTGRHFSLCRWLVAEKRYQLAHDELTALLKQDPDIAEARHLLTIVTAQLALVRERVDRAPDATASEPTSNRTIPVPLAEELLSPAEVNLIRVFEIDFRQPPKVHVARSTIRTLLENYRTHPEMPQSESGRLSLYQADPINIVRLMFAVRARELYPEIQVLSEPWALNLFRQRIHNGWLMNNCATSRCHGGPEPGRFSLYRNNYKNTRVRYTNFLILERLELDPEWPLINYERPQDSLIIQHGLPPDVAKRPHPDVPGWKPAFRRSSDRMLRSSLEWIDGMMRPRAEYPVDYVPPGRPPLEPTRSDR